MSSPSTSASSLPPMPTTAYIYIRFKSNPLDLKQGEEVDLQWFGRELPVLERKRGISRTAGELGFRRGGWENSGSVIWAFLVCSLGSGLTGSQGKRVCLFRNPLLTSLCGSYRMASNAARGPINRLHVCLVSELPAYFVLGRRALGLDQSAGSHQIWNFGTLTTKLGPPSKGWARGASLRCHGCYRHPEM